MGVMMGHGFLSRNLTQGKTEQATFLTLVLLVVLFSTFSHADSPPAMNAAETKLRISEVTSYLRKEGLQSVASLPSSIRETLSWFSRKHALDFTSSDEESTPATQNEALTDTLSFESALPMHLESSFHHKGFMPTHDSVVMGTSLHSSILDNNLQFTTHPFYGQSWQSLQHYWGSDVTMDIAERPDGLPYGKITMNYTSGTSSLTDHGRGIDLHGDVNLTHGWNFTSGIRQNDVSGNANYVSLRWKLDFP